MTLGTLRLGVAGTYVLDYDQAVSATAPRVDLSGTVGNLLTLRMRGSASWSVNQWAFNTFINYQDGSKYRVDNAPVGSWTTVDASIIYRVETTGWTNGTQLQLSAINLLKKHAPFVNQYTGFDLANGNDLGRSIGIEVTKRF